MEQPTLSNIRRVLLALTAVALACSGLEGDRADDVITGVVDVNGRPIAGGSWCPQRFGTGGETWMLGLADERWEVEAVGLRVGAGPEFVGVYQAAKGGSPQGHPNDQGVVEIGDTPCVRLTVAGPGRGTMVFDCVGLPVGVEYEGELTQLSIQGTLRFENCPFPAAENP